MNADEVEARRLRYLDQAQAELADDRWPLHLPQHDPFYQESQRQRRDVILPALIALLERGSTDAEVQSALEWVEHRGDGYQRLIESMKAQEGKRGGRPRKPADYSRKVRTYYATDAEYAAMQAKAETAGTDLSGLIRRTILGQS